MDNLMITTPASSSNIKRRLTTTGIVQQPQMQQQDLQRSLRHFLSISSAGDLNTIYRTRPVWGANDVRYLIDPAIAVFRDVPSAKLAVLNYIGLLVHEGTHLHLTRTEGHQYASSVDPSNIESAVQQLIELFEMKLERATRKEMLMDILRWGSLLLGEISQRNAGRRSVSNRAMPDLLRLYMTSPCIGHVFRLLDSVIKRLLETDPESCIAVLVAEASKYSSYYDWVLMHVGATFPGAMVNHLMSVGIDDFRAYVNDITNKEKLLVPTATINQLHEEYQLKFRSLSAILAHLAKQQNFELRDALKTLKTTDVNDLQFAFLFKIVTFSPEIFQLLIKETSQLLCADNVYRGAKLLNATNKRFIIGDRQYGSFLLQLFDTLDPICVASILDNILPIAFDSDIFQNIIE